MNVEDRVVIEDAASLETSKKLSIFSSPQRFVSDVSFGKEVGTVDESSFADTNECGIRAK